MTQEEITNIFKESVRQYYEQSLNKINTIYDIFKDFFGEDRVDLQDIPSIDVFESYILNAKITVFYINSYCENHTSVTSGIKSILVNYKITQLFTFPECYDILSDLFKIDYINNIYNGSLSYPFILIMFPDVRITNENGKYIDIQELWAKVTINYKGCLNSSFGLNRSKYDLNQFANKYIHSHVPRLCYDFLYEFRNPCLGSGPIRDTVCTLNKEYDENIWRLFCFELSKYVTVESLSGGPFLRLEDLNYLKYSILSTQTAKNYRNNNYILSEKTINEFIRYFINKKVLKFHYIDNNYCLGMSIMNYIKLISNTFIEWYNDCYNKGSVSISYDYLINGNTHFKPIIIKSKIINNKLHIDWRGANTNNNIMQYNNTFLWTFKGNDIKLSLVENAVDNNYIHVLDIDLSLFILNRILKLINFRYGRTEESDNNSKEYRIY